MHEIIKSFGCNLSEAIGNTVTISKALENQKQNKTTMHEMTKSIPIEEYEVFKKLGEGQFGNVFLVS